MPGIVTRKRNTTLRTYGANRWRKNERGRHEKRPEKTPSRLSIVVNGAYVAVTKADFRDLFTGRRRKSPIGVFDVCFRRGRFAWTATDPTEDPAAVVVTRQQFTAYNYVSHDECGKRLDGGGSITGGVRGVKKKTISRADVMTTTCRMNFGRTPGRPRHGNRVRRSRAALPGRLERKISLYRARRVGGGGGGARVFYRRN